MRTEAYVNRLFETAKDPKAKPDALVRAFEGAIREIEKAGPAGAKAVGLIEQRMAKRALRKLDA
jgi:hypothetical protein